HPLRRPLPGRSTVGGRTAEYAWEQRATALAAAVLGHLVPAALAVGWRWPRPSYRSGTAGEQSGRALTARPARSAPVRGWCGARDRTGGVRAPARRASSAGGARAARLRPGPSGRDVGRLPPGQGRPGSEAAVSGGAAGHEGAAPPPARRPSVSSGAAQPCHRVSAGQEAGDRGRVDKVGEVPAAGEGDEARRGQ